MAHLPGKNAPAPQPAPALPISKPRTMAPQKPTVPDGYKFCPSCQTALLHREFSKSNSTKDGIASSCRHCYAYYRKHNKMPNKKKQEPKQLDESYAQLRTFTSTEPYVPERVSHRNNGNKHILSRGV
jgi:DNA-directed RNA polymerase subunit M/transcription elongation factor TFIIS